MKKNKKLIINIIIVVIITFLLGYYILKEEGIDNLIYKFNNLNKSWIIIGVGFIFIYWILEALVLHVLTLKLYAKQKFKNSLCVTMVGQLFNNLTPFSSGGQPAQSYTMVKNGISVSNNTPILLVKFIIYQVALVVYTTIIVVLKYDYFKNEVSGFIKLSIIGFAINVIIVIVLFLIGNNKKLVHNIMMFAYKFLNKIKIIKNEDIDAKLEKLDKSLDNFHNNFIVMKKEIVTIILSFILSFIQINVLCSITYFIYRSFGYNGYNIFDIISAQAFLMMIMAFMPTPGAGGAAEGGFYIIFSKFFNEMDINVAMIVWRFITFYVPILVGMIFFVRLKKVKTSE